MDTSRDSDKAEALLNNQARIYAPIIWESTSHIQTEDLTEARYEEAIRLIKHHYFKEDPMCSAISVGQDYDSVECYLKLAMTWIKDTTSLCTVSIRSGRMVGVALCRPSYASEKSDTFHRVQILNGELLSRVKDLKNTLRRRTRVAEELSVEAYLNVVVLVGHPSYEERDVRPLLLKSCIRLAESSKLPAVAGIFTSRRDQAIAENLGFRTLSEIPYNEWIIDGNAVFNDPRTGSRSAALMATLIPADLTEDEVPDLEK